MKRVGQFLGNAIKTLGLYVTLFGLSVVLLSFQKKLSTPLTQTQLDDFAIEMNAKSFTQVESYYGAKHFEVIVEDIPETEVVVAATLHFSIIHNFIPSNYLFISPNESLYIVIDKEQNIFFERQ